MKTASPSPIRYGASHGARRPVTLLALIALCLLLGACGNKGSLVRPAASAAAAMDAPVSEGLESDGDPTDAGPPAEILPPPAEDPPAADAEGDG